MKGIHFKKGLGLIMITCLLLLQACTSADDQLKADLMGKWEYVSLKTAGGPVFEGGDIGNPIVEFKADGKLVRTEAAVEREQTWEVKDGVVILTDEAGASIDWNVVELTGEKLSIEAKDKELITKIELKRATETKTEEDPS